MSQFNCAPCRFRYPRAESRFAAATAGLSLAALFISGARPRLSAEKRYAKSEKPDSKTFVTSIYRPYFPTPELPATIPEIILNPLVLAIILFVVGRRGEIRLRIRLGTVNIGLHQINSRRAHM